MVEGRLRFVFLSYIAYNKITPKLWPTHSNSDTDRKLAEPARALSFDRGRSTAGAKQVGGFHAKCFCDPDERVQSRVGRSSLDVAHQSTTDAGLFGQVGLTHHA